MGARHRVAADIPAAARCAAKAFADDPLMHWLAGDQGSGAEAQERSRDGFFAPSIESGAPRGHTYVLPTRDGFAAFAVWSPPDVPLMREEDEGRFATAFAAAYGNEALTRLLARDALCSALHPTETHF